jgi:ribosomal protein S18 acetylase RimI-like enzyme
MRTWSGPDASPLIVPRDPAGRYCLTLATADDVATLAALYEEAAAWLTARGLRQWLTGGYTAEMAEQGMRAGHGVYLVRRDDEPVGKLTLQWDDAEMWGEQPPDAGYVHGLSVRRAVAGLGLGAALLDWAGAQVAAHGRRWLRLDCMAANPALRAYYERHGFIYRGEAEEGWAALYERPA